MKAILNTVTDVILTGVVVQATAQQAKPTTVPMKKTKYGHVYIEYPA